MDTSTSQRSACVVVVLLIAIAALVDAAPSPLSDDTSSSELKTTSYRSPHQGLETFERQRGRGSKMVQRIILPLLIGILLKVSSLLPVILAKLSLMAFGSLMTSKLALVIAGILIIHKFQTDHSWSSSFSKGHATESEDRLYTASYPYRRRG